MLLMLKKWASTVSVEWRKGWGESKHALLLAGKIKERDLESTIGRYHMCFMVNTVIVSSATYITKGLIGHFLTMWEEDQVINLIRVHPN
eukprot:scaffold39661_cov63-Cyclotella_meneghiniana.AAC.10